MRMHEIHHLRKVEDVLRDARRWRVLMHYWEQRGPQADFMKERMLDPILNEARKLPRGALELFMDRLAADAAENGEPYAQL